MTIQSLTRAGFIGLIAAVVGNSALFFIGKAVGALPDNVIIPNANAPLTIVSVIFATIFPAIIATLVFGLLARFTKRPVPVFIVIAVIVFLLTLYSPFSIPNVPAGMVVVLELMHVVTALAITYCLATLTTSKVNPL
ncbi:MAG: hypothetical protein H7Z75_10160 [Ferruginibacter sp.]|nr:hypothetical protein [Cytophagales bacterium]